MAQIQAMMKRRIETAEAEESVRSVSERMTEKGIGAILVVSNGLLEGIFTERDLLQRVVSEGRDPSRTTVGAVASRDPVTVGPKASIEECARVVKDWRVRHLPVVNDSGAPVGILSTRDFFEYVTEALEGLIEEAAARHRIEELTDPYSLI